MKFKTHIEVQHVIRASGDFYFHINGSNNSFIARTTYIHVELRQLYRLYSMNRKYVTIIHSIKARQICDKIYSSLVGNCQSKGAICVEPGLPTSEVMVWSLTGKVTIVVLYAVVEQTGILVSPVALFIDDMMRVCHAWYGLEDDEI